MVVILYDSTVQDGKTVYKDVIDIWISPGVGLFFLRATPLGPEYIGSTLPCKYVCEPGEDPKRIRIGGIV